MSKTETQSEAPINKLREAFEFDLIDNHAYTAPDLEKRGGYYADDEIQFAWEMAVVAWEAAHASTSSELRRLDAENKALRGLAAACYAGLGVECNLPENWLDALNAAANGEEFDTEGLLPFIATVTAPVAGQCRFKGEKAWELCTAEHVQMELADPNYGADGYEVRYLYAAPQAPAVDATAERDAAFEAVRQRLCKLPKYSFILADGDGGAVGVARRKDGSGRWIEFQAAHELLDPVAVDAAIAAQAAVKTGGAA